MRMDSNYRGDSFAIPRWGQVRLCKAMPGCMGRAQQKPRGPVRTSPRRYSLPALSPLTVVDMEGKLIVDS